MTTKMTPAKLTNQRPAAHAHRLSMATENYLLSIFRMDEQHARVTSTQLSEHLKTLPADEGLGTSLPSVVGMIRRMVREGLVNTTANKDVVLTPLGDKYAESIVRRHRLAERMVVDILGLELHKAHIEAHRLEHAISPELEEKIVEKLGNPITCPFGHPIPRSGYRPCKDSITLDKAVSGKDFEIERVPEDHQNLLEYFVKNNLVPGQIVRVKESSMARGIITLQSGANEAVFSYGIAGLIGVKPL